MEKDKERVYETGSEFFASANGYGGFKSYFADIFDPYKLTKLFILKGGPGTGKSSIMKRIAEFAKNTEQNYEIFRCSSDPASLDGVIIESQGKNIAVIDGTAPHTRDLILPGASDEIINLGEAWNSEKLAMYRKEIEFLNRKKAESYRYTYKNLSFSSVFDKNIKAEIQDCFDFKKADQDALDIISGLKKSELPSVNIRLISSFSKNGYKSLSPDASKLGNVKTVTGGYETDMLFITRIVEKIKNTGVSFTKIPSPLDENTFEGIYFPEDGFSILAGSVYKVGKCELLNAEKYLEKDISVRFEKYYPILSEARDKYMMLAEEELTHASEYHFSLEDIYTPCMDFSIIDKISDSLLFKIKNILSL